MAPSVLHYAGPVAIGGTQQACARCGEILQPGPDVTVWPEGTPILVTHRTTGVDVFPFEGITPGQFPDCRPLVTGGMTAARAAPFIPKRIDG